MQISRSKLFSLINALVGLGISRKEAYKMAVSGLSNSSFQLIELTTKKKGTHKRVVAPYGTTQTPKGTGRKVNPGLSLFEDVSKIILGINPVISTYSYRLIA